jgi:hypothetical protein
VFSEIDWGALAKVISVSLVVGAGLPSLFALGVRSLAHPDSFHPGGKRRRGRTATAVAYFAVVLSAACSAVILITNGN